MEVHHVGYLVKNIKKAQKAFEKLGFTLTKEPVYDEYRKIDISFMDKDGYTVELVSPAADDSVVSGLIKRFKNSPYHLCYKSFDFEKDIEELCSSGYVLIDEPTPAPAIGGKKVVFLMNASIGIVEVLEA